MNQLLVVKTIAALREKLAPLRRAGQRIGLVPTMGALHEGHISLARYSIDQTDCTVATIFVNPRQFSPGEDLEEYPRTIDEDIQKLSEVGVDFVLIPTVDEIYVPGSSTVVKPPDVASVLEGEFRPTHFEGVCTVVLKLFNIVDPHAAFFGQKDYQQAAVIRQMVSDLNLDIDIVTCPIVREADGLAMSSRNRYLSADERSIALEMKQAIQFAKSEIDSGETDAHCVMAEMRQRLVDAGFDSIDYVAICDPETLNIQNEILKPAVVLVAATVGTTRLIDNDLVE